MASQFPTNIVSTSNIPDANPLTSLSANNHAGKHNDLRDEIIAIETKVGKDGSAVTTTHDYKLSSVTGTDKAVGATQTVNLSNKTMVSPNITLGSDAIGDMHYNSSGATGAQSRIPVGSSGQILTSNGTNPYWTSPTAVNSNYIADTGAANAYVATLVPALGSYTAGTLVQFKAANANTGASTVNVNGLGAKTIKKLDGVTDLSAGDIKAGQIVELEYDGTNFQMVSPVGNVVYARPFGGDGTDGALSISSGTTTIDCANAAVVVKNYTSISITGTGNLAFTNPNTNGTVIILKSQGDVTITSSSSSVIDLRNMGAAGGAANVDGTTTFSNNILQSSGGVRGTGSPGAGGTVSLYLAQQDIRVSEYAGLTIGAGGGGSQTGATGAGGRGAGSLIIECNGAFNFTTGTINATGTQGTSGGNGIGGSGGSGSVYIRYKTLTANSGTISVGSTAGLGTGGGSFSAGGGGAGASNGGAGSGTSTGGAGGAGVSSVKSIY